mmetsp:Transcript_38238/g.86710  ORF Transcript_38238/g.86710 Transcript_38238/m.86710 type:complete len:126 (-) Transcript_38238:404-781(-)
MPQNRVAALRALSCNAGVALGTSLSRQPDRLTPLLCTPRGRAHATDAAHTPGLKAPTSGAVATPASDNAMRVHVPKRVSWVRERKRARGGERGVRRPPKEQSMSTHRRAGDVCRLDASQPPNYGT